MTYTIDRDATSQIVPVRILTDAEVAITGLLWNTAGLSADYIQEDDTVWTSITLQTMTQGTWIEGGFIEDVDAGGLYWLGLPDAAITAGKVTTVRVKTAGNSYRTGYVSATAISMTTALEDVWSYASRTLTQSVPASQDMGLNGRLTLSAGYNWEIPLTIGDLGTWTELYFTIKEHVSDTDAEAIVQAKLTNGGDPGDGLTLLNAAATTLENGKIVVNDEDTGDITVTIYADATVVIDANDGRFHYWDVKKISATGDAPATNTGGVLTVITGVTRATS